MVPVLILDNLNLTSPVLVIESVGPAREQLAELAEALIASPVFVLAPEGEGCGYGLSGFIHRATGQPAIELVQFNLQIVDAAQQAFAAAEEGDGLYLHAFEVLRREDSLPDTQRTFEWAAAWFEGNGVAPEHLPTPPQELMPPRNSFLSFLEVGAFHAMHVGTFVPGAAQRNADELLDHVRRASKR